MPSELEIQYAICTGIGRIAGMLLAYDPECVAKFGQPDEYDTYARDLWNLPEHTPKIIEAYCRSKEWSDRAMIRSLSLILSKGI